MLIAARSVHVRVVPHHSAKTKLRVQRLEEREVPATLLAVGADAGADPVVHAFAPGATVSTWTARPFGASWAGGITVAVADVTGDGMADVVAGSGAGGPAQLVVLDGRTGEVVRSWLAFAPEFTGGLGVAAADLNADGYADVVTGAGPGGGPHVRAFDGRTGADLGSVMAFEPTFLGGVDVAAGDTNGDGYGEVAVAAGAGGGPRLRLFDHRWQSRLDLFAYDERFQGGASVAIADRDGDGQADLITGAGLGGGPHVRAFDGQTGADDGSVMAGDPLSRTGARVFAADLDADGQDEIETVGSVSGVCAESEDELQWVAVPNTPSLAVSSAITLTTTPSGLSPYVLIAGVNWGRLASTFVTDPPANPFLATTVLSTADLQPGDVVVIGTSSLVSRTIELGTWSAFSHAAVYVGGGDVIHANLPGGVARVPLEGLLNHSEVAGVIRVPGLAPETGNRVVAAAEGLIGRGYNTAGLAVAALEKAYTVSTSVGSTSELIRRLTEPVQTNVIGEWLGGDSLFCSQLVREAYRLAGVQLIAPPLATPGDLVRAATSGPLVLAGRHAVGTGSNSEPIRDLPAEFGAAIQAAAPVLIGTAISL